VVLGVAGLSALGGTTGGAAVADDAIYRPMGRLVPTGAKVRVRPDEYSAVRVDLAAARARLRGAPGANARSALVFEVPTPEGGTERFALHRTRVMAPRLAAAHPEIATYAGRSLDHTNTTIALDITPMGLHAAVRGPGGQDAWYVDPAYDKRGTDVHLSYHRGAMPSPEETFVEQQAPELRRQVTAPKQSARVGGTKVTQKVYRLALVNDPSYAEYFGTENVLAAKTTLINRVNQIYNADLAIRLELIEDSEKLNFDNEADAIGPDGPCGAHPCYDPRVGDPANHDGTWGQLEFCDLPTLGRNRIVLGQLVGASNYDVGHIALGLSGGGVAYIGVVGADYKGGGCTGLPEPKGDFFAIDYVAHELGHQFHGNHTYASCLGEGNGTTAVEPGSGSTVMAYAGICAQDDLQPHTDPYFSGATVDEINRYTNGAHPPVVEVQTVSLDDFGPGDTLTLTYKGNSGSLDYEEYSPLTVENLVESIGAVDDLDVTIADWGYDPGSPLTGHQPPDPTDFDTTGFQVIFAPTPFPDDPSITDAEDYPMLELSGVPGTVGETAQGGSAANGGHEKVATGNTAPTVRAPADRTIPKRTPFKLSATAKDADGGRPTVIWEQLDWTDLVTPLTSNAKRFGPLFRVFGGIAHVSYEDSLQSPARGQNRATTNGTRYFPDLAQVLSGNTNAKTGTCPVVKKKDAPVPFKLVDCYSEFLPTAAYRGTPGKGRALHFRVTARDGHLDGGGLGHDSVTLRVAPKAGPFLVKSFARKGVTVKGGSKYVVRWQVKGTQKLARKVQLLLSYNGGKNWKNLLRRTPNDGKVRVKIPKHRTKNARLMVRAVGNYFYDVNDRPFRIR